MATDLRSQTVSAMSHLGFGGMIGRITSLSTTLILARLLNPTDYGLMEIAMTIVGFLTFFNDIGIGSAIVQKPELSTSEVNGCFALALAISTIILIATVMASGPIAVFFKHAELQSMISALACSLLLGAASTVPQAFLRRDMQFKAIAGVNFLAVLIQSVVCLVLAATGFGVWSLVWGSLTSALVNSVGYFAMSPWRPRGRYGIREARDLAVYGMHVMTSRIFWFLHSNADRAIVGKLLGPTELGVYGMAFSLATLPNAQFTSVAVSVGSPIFSKLQFDLPRLSSIIIKLTRGIAYVTYPVLLGMLAVSNELIYVVLGPKWMAALLPFGALCIMGLVKSIDPLLAEVLTAAGNVRKLTGFTAMCAVIMPLAFVAGAWLDGLRGVSIAWIVVYPLLSMKLLHDVCKLTGMTLRQYYGCLLPVLTGAVVMALVVLAVRMALYYVELPIPAILVLEIIAGALTYMAWIIYVDRDAMAEIRQTMIDFGIARSRINKWPFVR
jgi:O-antigen/teichoic acid export membrane protein